MEIRAIKTFITVIKHGSFKKASEVLNYSQPTVTLHIKSLEDHLGKELIVRGKTIKLTEAGHVFYKRAKSLLKEYERLEQTMDGLGNGNEGYIRIGVSEPIASLEFPKIISQFLQKHPNIEYKIEISDSDTLSKMLDQNQIDFAVCDEPEKKVNNHFQPLFEERIVLLVPKFHRFGTRNSVRLNELENELFIFTSQNYPLEIKVENEIKQATGKKYKKLIINDILAQKHYVNEGLGIAFLPSGAKDHLIPDLKKVEIEDLKTKLVIGLLMKEEVDSFGCATKQLLSLIMNYFTYKKDHEQLQVNR
ncbi:LysR family transcriptional regulator [Ureibacillus acetophenoni]|uniref:LysR family transcriptional regulator n=1 Tax=Ureibacillus acetophenoni TaxID=614649 RepID=A0A285UGW4_9BACL|nr:LysR family transcriptional regulator [Ureibacillus acetophenoni]SOC40907.1 LysR family transcriptional regulator [Ureibacillus acetophenoni]